MTWRWQAMSAELQSRNSDSLSELARERMRYSPAKPIFVADWERVLMIHYEVEPQQLQAAVPFELDLHDGRTFVSLVAFTLSGMRPWHGGKLAAWLLKPIATHEFLNVRTYARCDEEAGIYFVAEWLSNRFSVALGPKSFGLPYRFGSIKYDHRWADGVAHGRVEDGDRSSVLSYEAQFDARCDLHGCDRGSLTEWLMERYTAFTSIGSKRRFFRVWHLPWPQVEARVTVSNRSLLERNWLCFREARIVSANFSPGVRDVWMGRPLKVRQAIPRFLSDAKTAASSSFAKSPPKISSFSSLHR